MKKRSVGVTIVGWLLMLHGVSGLLVVLVSAQGIAGALFPLTIVSGILVSLFTLITGIGVLMLRSWAWSATLIVAGIFLIWQIRTVAGLAIGESFASGPQWLLGGISIIGYGLVIRYFLRPSVKAQFQRSG